MRGNALGLSWQNGVKLNKTGVDTWQADITYTSTVGGFRCQYCSDNSSFTGHTLEYRIYIDDKVDMVGGNLHLNLPISQVSSYFNDAPKFYAYPWFFSKKGSASVFHIPSPQIGKNRSILLYRPPSYYENTYKTYPSIVVWDLNEEAYNVSADLINAPVVDHQTVQEFMMVGFGDYQPASERNDLLTQVVGVGFMCNNGSFSNGCNGCFNSTFNGNYTDYLIRLKKCTHDVSEGGKGNDTLDFIIQTVLPKLRNITQQRMLTDQPNLGVMGYSLGGLMACHAAWTRPDVFGFAACQSPSLWWPKINDDKDGFFFNNVSLKDSNLRFKRPYQRILLDAGGTETQSPFTLTQAMVAAAEDMSTTGWFEWNKNLWADVYPGDIHSGQVWVSRIWKPLKTFFPTNPAPNINNLNCGAPTNPIIIG